MSLPPGFLDELRTRTSLSQVVGRKVMWDQRKSNQAKGDMWAQCPFHQEKSSSFHVDDRKGFYYCFGCHAKGDAISFVRETENVDFMEAIKILAQEAGMTMPARDPQAQKKADKRTLLAEVMEQAVQFYRLQLKTGNAAGARDYLDGRGLSEAALNRWEIGFAPDQRQGVFQHLTAKGVAPDLIIGAGLAAVPDNGGAPYDRFRGRIIFPIRDARGRAIALGGRSLDPNARAKYLNSPETELFDKGRSLYNHGPAREAAGKGHPLIVSEGYMDTIALSEAGFGATVAPLGTAITENQLQLLWRIAPEPIIALDGDKAGLRAAMRLIDLALPLLEAGQSLRFVILPEGKDPDDLLRAQGAGAMQALVDAAQPMVKLLWQRETEGKVFDSPERKAAFDKTLRAAIKTIKDPSIRAHYGEEIKQLRWELFNPRRKPFEPGKKFGGKGWKSPAVSAHHATKNSSLVNGGLSALELREGVVLATLILHPDVTGQFETALERIECTAPDHQAMLNIILRMVGRDSDEIKSAIFDDLGPYALENLFGARHVGLAPTVRNPGDIEIATICVAEEIAKLEAGQGVQREVEDALQDLTGVADEGLTWRLQQAAEARNRAVRSESEDKAEYDVGDNGLALNRAERSRLNSLLENITFAKGKSR
ncbi:DNA primase [Cochlodiniinecator piscidefendens]|uniref:DNA primase n=1 Tax=Cochlodiniinecator piscidefendens TaxID=2715756 RepID=UPI00140CA47B|nr:DNA primase [Cochlodiniinecator piscidefendens]